MGYRQREQHLWPDFFANLQCTIGIYCGWFFALFLELPKQLFLNIQFEPCLGRLLLLTDNQVYRDELQPFAIVLDINGQWVSYASFYTFGSTGETAVYLSVIPIKAGDK